MIWYRGCFRFCRFSCLIHFSTWITIIRLLDCNDKIFYLYNYLVITDIFLLLEANNWVISSKQIIVFVAFSRTLNNKKHLKILLYTGSLMQFPTYFWFRFEHYSMSAFSWSVHYTFINNKISWKAEEKLPMSVLFIIIVIGLQATSYTVFC